MAGPRDSDPTKTHSASHLCPLVAASSLPRQCGLLQMADVMLGHGSDGLLLAVLAIREMSPVFPIFFPQIPRNRRIAPSARISLLDHSAL